jgi:hypothetical protein
MAAVISYRVHPGDTLSSVSRRLCGHAAGWPALWAANRRQVRNPDAVRPGQRLTAACGPVSARLADLALDARPRPAPVRAAVAVAHAAPAPAPAPSPAPNLPPSPAGYSGPGGFQSCVIAAESGGNPQAYNASSGASGLYGFLLSTWDSLGVGYPGGAYTAPVSVQNQGFAIEYARAGVSPWRAYDGC